MSLKAFHIVFVGVSFLLALVFAGWEINRFMLSGNSLELWAGIASILVAGALLIYGIRFMKKLKNVRMI
jgi:predicted membrane protein